MWCRELRAKAGKITAKTQNPTQAHPFLLLDVSSFQFCWRLLLHGGFGSRLSLTFSPILFCLLVFDLHQTRMGDLRVSSCRPNGAVWPLDKYPSMAADNEDAEGHWTVVEEATDQVLRTIHPTLSSERQRALVISYVQRLLSCSLSCQVFPYGSVPLKTYLPDGDIDLTVLSSPDAEDALISDIFDVLKTEELNEGAEFEVTDVQLISAEVKLVKCLIQNFIVDISCNQLGGLCTLCFLEQIDRLVDKDHLFKRSIILIKAWCYYESRILGATHGLFSTYALEILVLYIFHIYHSTLKGPSSVLYRFLDYFSNFDWENHCVSLRGPVCESSLHDVVARTHEVSREGLLLSKQFLTNSTSMFTVPSREFGEPPKPFQQKFINIIDPLKDNNNLGRSVNKGNFYRIRSALKFGAHKLGHILTSPTESARKELKHFFANTLARHGSSLQVSSQPSDPTYSSSFRSSDTDSSLGVRSPRGETERTSDSSSQASDASSCHRDRSIQTSHNVGIALEGEKWGETIYQNGLLDSSSAKEVGAGECGEGEGAKMNRELKGVCIEREPMVNITALSNSPTLYRHRDMTSTCSAALGPHSDMARVSPKQQSWNFIDHNEISEPLKSLSDLTGDYGSHLQSLLYGQSFHGNTISLPMLYNVPVWDLLCQTVNFGQDPYFQLNADCAMWGKRFRQVRGTGTYIPRTYVGSWRGERLPVRRGKNQTRGRSSRWQIQQHNHNFDLGMIPVQANVNEQIYHEAELLESRQSATYPFPPYDTGSLSEQSKRIEFSSSEPLPKDKDEGDEEKDEGDEKAAEGSLESPSNQEPPPVLIPEPQLVDAKEDVKSVAGQPYQLKDEADFPPLTPRARIPIRRSVYTS